MVSDALFAHCFERSPVLILVLMEYGLWHSNITYGGIGGRTS